MRISKNLHVLGSIIASMVLAEGTVRVQHQLEERFLSEKSRKSTWFPWFSLLVGILFWCVIEWLASRFRSKTNQKKVDLTASVLPVAMA